jgi:transposase-like protein
MSKSKAGDGNRRDGGKERIWREAIADQQRSCESVKAFCRARGLNESSFYRWRKKIRLRDRQTGGEKNAPPLLAPVVVVDGPSTREPSASIEIVLAGGTTVRVPSGATREQLGMVFAVLELGGC